ncbi:MAG: Chromosomal replication initiator protein DnaA [Candidatus Nomurabacteria bacterium GW2011_GWF2_35_12]|uniref:Chromosomal replication initiator protein DnaA n=3 Tax=Candidatus Nomuraibacteriota TaxID=1752729 RepID=A0A0G0EA29_9BACT|nr:MAG: Chromosomal replication initiator protein DnaA [Candidatus Nomurabacteria bacterium GW2011_GWF2_35_12]KKP72796.1 MAG: Chromosomal replication initiator protein DnaA [Candidatus Nomurabacteria bacterium GW2011_GWB1_35_20]KKP75527.1 MAG: Chromosomal replication initiator protein DnaA [Parcubacteria group bacterium GW2011_GWC1_35_21]KKP78018.1 MAG: Chromosomal replication initiator protein DnaA [Candidatus Nomurabacteria bacterium GW2011_GWC2_35_35]KKP85439.1 MAG: Chromosomal replication i
MDTKQLWKNCLVEIEGGISKANFSTWFKNTHILKEETGIVYVGVPNEFVRDWLKNKYHKLITKTIADAYENMRAVEYIITKTEASKQEISPMNEIYINKELPLKDLYINPDDNLNPRYRFDSFIVGPFNELAYAASQAIIENPGTKYNPFFVYGGTGLGKTHLIQAIGNAIKDKHPNKKVHYLTLEKFATDFINSLQNNKANSFKEKYRKYDLLIIDDIQFIGKMEKIQEELFHTFNTFYENNKQIIFSSDKHPNYIPELADRLKSRFAAGMIVDVSEPEYESRLAILKVKLRELSIDLEQEIIEYVAETIQGNIRELEGSLNIIVCQYRLKNKPLSVSEVKNLIKNNIRPKKNVAIKDVVKIVSDYYSLEESLVYEKTRRKEIVKARQVVMYLLREDFNVSYPLIGQKLGGKDHTTVIHSYLKIKADLKNNPQLLQELEQIRIMFK